LVYNIMIVAWKTETIYVITYSPYPIYYIIYNAAAGIIIIFNTSRIFNVAITCIVPYLLNLYII